MHIRTTETQITFEHPFRLPSVEGLHPAGTYRLVTDEEEIPGLTFIAFQRRATMLHLPEISLGGTQSVVLVEADELDAALKADGVTPSDLA